MQALLTSLNEPQSARGLQGGSYGPGPRDDPIGVRRTQALGCLQARPNSHEIVSTTSDYHQTFPTLSVFDHYPSLHDRLVEWCIDLAIADKDGLTALHFAYMRGDPDIVRIRRRGGASECATDKLGRTRSELQQEGPEKFDSDIDLHGNGAKLAADLHPDVYPEADDIKEQLELGERFSRLDSGDDNGLFTGSSGASERRGSKESAIRIMNHLPWRETNGGRRIVATECSLVPSMTCPPAYHY